jgi:L-ascorbate metabolism protein UlaG (beta-lactamase superfamily)
MNNELEISYYGQSLFVIESASGTKIGIDPYNKFTRSSLPDLIADIVLITHKHPDHANVSLFKGNPEVLRSPGIANLKGINIEGIQVYHDNLKGFLRGKNIIFKFEVDGVVFAHLGDIGHTPSDAVINKLLDVDVLMIPIGGVFTIGYKKAYEIINNFNPKIVIPMHYKEQNPKIKLLDTIDNFLSLIKNYRMLDSTVKISKDKLPENTEVWILKSSS